MLLVACAAPVVAPGLVRGTQGALGERAGAQGPALDRKGQHRRVFVEELPNAAPPTEVQIWCLSLWVSPPHVVTEHRTQELSDCRLG